MSDECLPLGLKNEGRFKSMFGGGRSKLNEQIKDKTSCFFLWCFLFLLSVCFGLNYDATCARLLESVGHNGAFGKL